METYSVIEVPKELFAPAAYAHYEGQFELGVMKAGPDFYDFLEPLTWSVDISNTGDALLLQGEVEGVGRTSCVRCLEPVDIDFFGELDGYYLLDPESAPEDMEGDEFDILADDHKIDLEPLIMSALLLDVPYVPLCDDDCKGICPECGVNLNNETCTCAEKAAAEAAEEAVANNPFAVLKGLNLE